MDMRRDAAHINSPQVLDSFFSLISSFILLILLIHSFYGHRGGSTECCHHGDLRKRGLQQGGALRSWSCKA